MFSPAPQSGESWPAPEGPAPIWRSDLGFLGESEVVRLLAESGEINVFRPFPDLETSELAVRHLENRRVVGVQVKTGGVDSTHPTARINVRVSSCRPSPTTYFVVLAWSREDKRFHEEILLIPSEQIDSVCEPGHSDGHLAFEWHPGSAAQQRLNPFRVPLDRMRYEIENQLTR